MFKNTIIIDLVYSSKPVKTTGEILRFPAAGITQLEFHFLAVVGHSEL